ncbi:Dynactin subunit 3 [Amphibalanus amphitrite]|uniref:Dynactin subunit 3 n=1 Tax=Amphibalanus amphitrite TaxID=1232801 RepID=A0A6A4W5X8_AMPAM|nr:Dynactin subunit 3 [Amphibalanus amphitrite]KAF0300709.1 Dynactin subunit 3 [Amphibalanus amphitrite]
MGEENLEGRVSALEDKIFGDLDKNEQYTKATDVILGFNSRMGNVLGDYERAVMIMKRLEELESYLDPLYGEQLAATPAALVSELLATEGQLAQVSQQLDKVRQLAPLLDSEHIKGAGELRGRLEAVSERHLSQAQRLTELQAAGQRLAHAYAQAVATLGVSLLQLEERVARVEAAN